MLAKECRDIVTVVAGGQLNESQKRAISKIYSNLSTQKRRAL
jgi:hypothetical protein